jgi:hypothetical protein
MAAWAKGRLGSKIPALAQALSGRRRDHHWRLLASQVAHLDFLDEQIEALGTDMTRCLRTCARRRSRPRHRCLAARATASHHPVHRTRR